MDDSFIPPHDPGPAPNECQWHWRNGPTFIVRLNDDGTCPLAHEHQKERS